MQAVNGVVLKDNAGNRFAHMEGLVEATVNTGDRGNFHEEKIPDSGKWEVI